MHQLVVSKGAAKRLGALPQNEARRVLAAIRSLAEEPRPPGCKKLKGKLAGHWRIRVGDYRVLYTIQDEVLIVVVVDVGPRGDIYG